MKKRFIVLPLIIVGGLGFSLFNWVESPATSTPIVQKAPTSGSVLGSSTTLHDWTASSFSTKVPDTMRLRTSNESSGVGSYMLSSTDSQYTDQIGITVAPLGNNSLSEIPGVQFRLNHPTDYTPTTVSYAPPGAYVFSATNGYEVDIFWQQAGQYASVAVSGLSSRSSVLDEASSDIVSNWVW